MDKSLIASSALLKAIQQKAVDDANFRRNLLENPKEALSVEGIEFSASTKVTVIESVPQEVVINIPPLDSDSEDADRELEIKELSGVSGGLGISKGFKLSFFGTTITASKKTIDSLKLQPKDIEGLAM